MKLRHLLLMLGLVPSGLHAATEFENGLVPQELVRQFTSGAVYRSLPDGFPVVSLPAGTDVRLLGGMQRGSTRDALLTSQNVAALHEALVTAYKAAGWISLTVASSSTESTVLCNDAKGLLTISRPTPAYNGLRLTHSAVPFLPGQGCASSSSQGTTQWLDYFFSLLPTLTPPPQTRPAGTRVPYLASLRSARFASASASGGAVVLESTRDIDVPDINMAGLYAHFAARLGEQGWSIDSEDTGMKSASAILFKTAAPPANVAAGDTQLTGYFSILNTGGSVYRVNFSFEAATDAQVNLGGSWVPYDILGNGLPPLNDPQIGIRGVPAGFFVP